MRSGHLNLYSGHARNPGCCVVYPKLSNRLFAEPNSKCKAGNLSFFNAKHFRLLFKEIVSSGCPSASTVMWPFDRANGEELMGPISLLVSHV